MAIFKISNTKLSVIEEESIKLEKDLQKLTEENLDVIFGFKFISSEFAIQKFRLDTLAFDEETKSFVIIEYKRDRSFSVVDQGFSYLSTLLNNKDSFILEYARKTKMDLNNIKVDWSQSKVVFISQSFTSYQQNAINFKDLPIELWEVSKYKNNSILYNRLKSVEGSDSINTISKDKTIDSVSREIKKYTLDDYFKEGWEKSKNIFDALEEKILGIDDKIERNVTKFYVGYNIGKMVLVAITPRKSKLRVELYRVVPKDMKDPDNKVSYSKNSMKHYNKHISEFFIDDVSDIDYAMFLITQVYNKIFK
ncbi:DUF91 domain-containing protein [Candidatus Woesearchaeota archaeon]|jgi:predicted transport protein|nr:DUF91 domain-containing protein [Candidatus Woesearchaeota archaeon]